MSQVLLELEDASSQPFQSQNFLRETADIQTGVFVLNLRKSGSLDKRHSKQPSGKIKAIVTPPEVSSIQKPVLTLPSETFPEKEPPESTYPMELERYDETVRVSPKKRYILKVFIQNIRKGKPLIVEPEDF